MKYIYSSGSSQIEIIVNCEKLQRKFEGNKKNIVWEHKIS